MPSDYRQYQLEQTADKSILIAALLGVFVGPLAYVYIGKWTTATINLFTINYLMLGIVIVPIHVTLEILRARKTVRGMD